MVSQTCMSCTGLCSKHAPFETIWPKFNESEVPVKRLLLMGRLITEPKIAPAVKTLFDSRVNSYFNLDISSMVFFCSHSHCTSST